MDCLLGQMYVVLKQLPPPVQTILHSFESCAQAIRLSSHGLVVVQFWRVKVGWNVIESDRRINASEGVIFNESLHSSRNLLRLLTGVNNGST